MNKADKTIQGLKFKKQYDARMEAHVLEKINELRNTDLAAVAAENANIEEFTKDMSEPEKKQFKNEMENIANSYSNVLDVIAEYFEDPDTREKIIEELKRRV